MRSLLLPALLLALPGVAGVSYGQNQVKGRVLVMVDSSGSMVWHFGDCATATGDGAPNATYCDNAIGTGFACNQNVACTQANGGVNRFPVANVNNPSRLFAAKQALNNVINSAAGDLDFGLERYALNGNCPNGVSCCSTQINGTTRGRCVNDTDYATVNGGYPNITTSGGCGTTGNCVNCAGTQGGQMLVTPNLGSSSSVLPWIDSVEDFCSSTGVVGGFPRNPELHAAGGTPLAGAVRTARAQWYQTIYNVSKKTLPNGQANPQYNPASPVFDPQLDCRPYVNVVMTDGAETCEDPSQWFTDPQTAVGELTAVNSGGASPNPVKTYVIGMSFAQSELCAATGADDPNAPCPRTGPNNGCKTVNNVAYCSCTSDFDCGNTCDGFGYTCGNDGICHHPALAALNAMASAGGTQFARFANNQTDIEAAFADIAASSVLFEVCNGKDDNCNNLVDEGLGVYQECSANGQCASGTCNQGRCTCANNGQCQNGFSCGAGFCVPACSVGVGACMRSGVRKCSGNGVQCCVNDGLAACTTLVAGNPSKEICNGIDDDCNGIVDDPPVCQTCTPTAEVCDGKDNDCDGIIDNNLIDTGKACGLSVGVCMAGKTACVPDNGKNFPDASDHLICQGGVQPQAPQCNGCDNDCDGVLDAPTQSCYDGPNGTNGVGICHGGLQKCTANTCPQQAQYGACVGEVTPQKEICNGLDDDCNGMIDDVQGAGQACCPSGKCGVGICKAGTQQCSGGQLACVGGVGPGPEVCDGLDNDCNGKVDDLPNLGMACVAGNGCSGTLVCDAQKMAMVCQPTMQNCQPMDCANDPNLGKPCGNPNNLPPPCMAGKLVCLNGMLICQGAVGPSMEVCDGVDNNCDGMVDNMAPCPVNFSCYNGQCDPVCGGGEFPCPGGYTPVTVKGVCLCVPDKACNPPCMNGTTCDPQTGTCVDPCAKVSCPAGLKCSQGSCYGCEKFGCGSCERCDLGSHLCVTDKCCNVTCTGGKFCDPGTGTCVATCDSGCPAGQICQSGMCAVDKCYMKSCPEQQACDPKSGLCVQDPCYQVDCGPNLTCCSGACTTDPCAAIACPTNTVCHVNSLTCGASCDALPAEKRDEIVGAGGGGFACSVGTRPSSARPLWLLGALLLVGLRRRRRARAAEVKHA